MKRYNYILPVKMADGVAAYAASQDKSASSVVRAAISAYMVGREVAVAPPASQPGILSAVELADELSGLAGAEISPAVIENFRHGGGPMCVVSGGGATFTERAVDDWLAGLKYAGSLTVALSQLHLQSEKLKGNS